MVIPLIIFATISLFIALKFPEFQHDVFVNLATDLFSIIITVFYVDWIIKQHERERWNTSHLYIQEECGALGFGFISVVVKRLGLFEVIFPVIDIKTFSLKELQKLQYEIVERTNKINIEDIIQILSSFDKRQWKKFVEVIEVYNEKSDKLIEKFISKTEPEELAILFEFRRGCSNILTGYEILEIFFEAQDSKSNMRTKIYIRMISLDVKRVLDIASNIIDQFGYHQELYIDYEREIKKLGLEIIS